MFEPLVGRESTGNGSFQNEIACADAARTKGPRTMYVEEIRRAVLATPRERLAEIQVALWKSHAVGAIGDDDANPLPS